MKNTKDNYWISLLGIGS